MSWMGSFFSLVCILAAFSAGKGTAAPTGGGDFILTYPEIPAQLNPGYISKHADIWTTSYSGIRGFKLVTKRIKADWSKSSFILENGKASLSIPLAENPIEITYENRLGDLEKHRLPVWRNPLIIRGSEAMLRDLLSVGKGGADILCTMPNYTVASRRETWSRESDFMFFVSRDYNANSETGIPDTCRFPTP